MKKLELLREHLLARIPGLAANPERLLTFIEDGSIEFHRGASLSHQYTVPALIVLTDYSGDLDLVMLPLLQWLSHYQPDLKPAEAVSFQAELLGNKCWDLALKVMLTERVVARLDCSAGRIEIEHRTPEFPIDPCSPAHWRVFARDGADTEFELVAEWGEPPGEL